MRPFLRALVVVALLPAALASQSRVDALRRAAEQGNPDAQIELGAMYADGLGVPQDYVQALRWLRRAARQGFAPAQAMLGAFYAAGRGVLKDEVEAKRWFRRAAEQGNAYAQYRLGYLYVASVVDGALGRVIGDGFDVFEPIIRGEDLVAGHAWLNIASANGADPRAGRLRDALEPIMTKSQRARATELARACMASSYKDCPH